MSRKFVLAAGALSLTAALAAVTSPAPTTVPAPSIRPAGFSRSLPSGIPTIDVAKVKGQLAQIEEITNQNGGHRYSDSSGERALRRYIIKTLRTAGYQVKQQVCPPTACSGNGAMNILADWKGGDTDAVYIFGAHIDSVATAPGINDNGSGVAAVLQVAITLAAENPAMAKKVRFAFWGDEEQYLNGSRYYAETLGDQKSKIKGYLNFEMIGSPNGGYFINHLDTPLGVVLKSYYDAKGVDTEENIELAQRSDNYPFEIVGIPTTGVAAGARNTKTIDQANKWGGTAHKSYDSCYHTACDTTANINDTILDHATNAQITALYQLAVDGYDG